MVVAISPNFAQDQTVLAATSGLTIKLGAIVLYKSTDGGVSWAPAPGLVNNSQINAVVFSPAYSQDQTVFAATGSGLYVSKDGANTWSSLSPDSLLNLALSANFANDNTLFAITAQSKLLKSVNRGVNFTAVSVPTSLTGALTIITPSPNYDTDHSLLLGSAVNGIFKSFNNGSTWNQVTPGMKLPKVLALAYSPAFNSDQTVFAGTLGSGVLVSTSTGNSWALSNTGLADTNVSSLAFSPTYAQNSTMWATTAVDGVFQSTNKGASWANPVTVPRQLSDLTNVHYQSIAVGPGIQVLGMFEGLWTSTNGGSSFQYIDIIPTRMVRYIHPSPNFAVDRNVFVTTYGSGNLWSTDGGNTWTLQNTGMAAPYEDGSAISPNFANDQMAFSGNHIGLDRTKNAGASWTLMPGPGASAYPRGFAISPNFVIDKTIYIGTTSASGHTEVNGHNDNAKVAAGLYVSTNQGQTWTLSGLKGEGVVSIAFSPAFATDQTAFAATQSNGLYITTNGAKTWTPITVATSAKDLAQVVVSPGFPADGVVFVSATGGGIYKSGNAGSTWTLLPNTKNLRSLDIGLSPNYPLDQTMFVGTEPFGLMESTNGGASLVQTPFPDVFASAVGISTNFTADQTVFAAGYHGLFKSTDGGNTWTYLVTPARIEESRNIASTLQEPPTIVYQGAGWTMVTPELLASTNEFASTAESQATETAVLSFSGSGVRWISWTGPDQGGAIIQLDGITLGNVSLTGPVDLLQQTVWEQHGLACGFHTFTITAPPQTASTVTLDAFDVWQDGCPFTNPANAAGLSASSMSTSSAAGNGSVTLTTGGSWTAASDAPWLSISPGSASGAGNALVQFTFNANTSSAARIGTLTIAGQTYMVSQSAGN
jgi:photosystem II stability/assembly factor-like uncharacterized protein